MNKISKIVELPEFELSKGLDYNLALLKTYLIDNGTYTEEEFEKEIKKMLNKDKETGTGK